VRAAISVAAASSASASVGYTSICIALCIPERRGIARTSMAPVVLSIAGSDPSGGAGIQADLKTFLAFDVYGAAVVTSLTVQNTVGVRDRMDVPPAVVAAQIDAVLDDLPVAAIKTGLLPDAAVVESVVDRLRARPVRALVVDPVLIATSGHALTATSALAAIRDQLLPLATLVTPNLAEAAALVGGEVDSRAAMRDAARALVQRGAKAVLVKGGHLDDEACDVLATADAVHELVAPRIEARSRARHGLHAVGSHRGRARPRGDVARCGTHGEGVRPAGNRGVGGIGPWQSRPRPRRSRPARVRLYGRAAACYV
jgi:hydroxymethylpyrimidine/phosphomethylpyrimidine kinase